MQWLPVQLGLQTITLPTTVTVADCRGLSLLLLIVMTHPDLADVTDCYVSSEAETLCRFGLGHRYAGIPRHPFLYHHQQSVDTLNANGRTVMHQRERHSFTAP